MAAVDITIPVDPSIFDKGEDYTIFYREHWENEYYVGKFRLTLVNLTPVNLTLEEGFTAIAEGAFKGVEQLQTIKIPASLVTIQTDAFVMTKNLRKIMFEQNSQIASIGQYAFSRSGLTQVVIGESALDRLNVERNSLNMEPLHFGENNNFYGKGDVEIVPSEPQINPRLRVTRKPDGDNSSPSGVIFNFFNGLRSPKIVSGPAGGARKSRTRRRRIRRKSKKASTTRRMQKRTRTMKRK